MLINNRNRRDNLFCKSGLSWTEFTGLDNNSENAYIQFNMFKVTIHSNIPGTALGKGLGHITLILFKWTPGK